MRTSHLLLIATAAAIFALAAAMPGGWEAIPNVTDPHVQELGSWAVAYDSKATGDWLKFIKVVSGKQQVVSGKQQVVSGMNYRLVILAANGPDGQKSTCEADVYEQRWTKKRKLWFFSHQLRN